MTNNLLQSTYHLIKEGHKKFAILIDPDKINHQDLPRIIETGIKCKVDFFLVGGSLLTYDHFDACISVIKSLSTIPVIIFPGSNLQISSNADAILLLSLISGRNADLLIGQHVNAVYKLKSSKLEIISTGYMLVESDKITATQYVSQTLPLPKDKPEIAVATAIAGEMLGMNNFYLEAGSGAGTSVSNEMISAVKANIHSPLWVGGGITTPEMAEEVSRSGADITVIGTAIEHDTSLIEEFSYAIHDSGKEILG